jgi:hypothetical protein
MITFNGEPESNARAEQLQFENTKNGKKDAYKCIRTRKTKKWTDSYEEGQRQETLTQCREFYSIKGS